MVIVDTGAVDKGESEVSHAGEVPPMPTVSLDATNVGFAVTQAVKHVIGWQRRSQKRGGDCFLVARSTFAGYKSVAEFPLTEDGWAQAWRMLAELDRTAADVARHALDLTAFAEKRRTDLGDVRAETLACLQGVIFLGGYTPAASLVPKERYDLRFLQEMVGVYEYDGPRCLLEITYGEVDAVDIGGPGLVKSGGGFLGGGFGVAGAAEGMAIAAVLNAVTTQVKIKTVVRIQATGCELFMLHSSLEPDALRIELSRPLVAIREAQQAKSAKESDSPGVTGSVGEELQRFADLLDRGLLSREEFELIKAKLIASI